MAIADFSFDGVQRAMSGAPQSVPGSMMLKLIGLGGSDLEKQFEAIKREVAEIRGKVEQLLTSLDQLARQIAWVRLGLQAHPATMRIWSKYLMFSNLSPTNIKTRERLKAAILSDNDGVSVDLLSLHRVIVGHSSLDPGQPSLLVNWIAKAQEHRGAADRAVAINAYVSMLSALQYKGIILLVSAHLAYGEETESQDAMGLMSTRLNEQNQLLRQHWQG